MDQGLGAPEAHLQQLAGAHCHLHRTCPVHQTSALWELVTEFSDLILTLVIL